MKTRRVILDLQRETSKINVKHMNLECEKESIRNNREYADGEENIPDDDTSYYY